MGHLILSLTWGAVYLEIGHILVNEVVERDQDALRAVLEGFGGADATLDVDIIIFAAVEAQAALFGKLRLAGGGDVPVDVRALFHDLHGQGLVKLFAGVAEREGADVVGLGQREHVL